jgi:uncharacterized repeat protein (TIGR02543 family)
VPNVNTTYTARWITWNANGGGVVSIPPISIALGPGTVFNTLPTVSRAGHVFDGWYTHQTQGVQIRDFNNNFLVPSTSTTYWARWIPRRQASVDLFADNVWQLNYPQLSWMGEADNIFQRARVPFLQRWNIDLVAGEPMSFTTPWIHCSHADCITGCGNDPEGTDCRANHCKSGARAVDHSLTISNAHLSMIITGRRMCNYNADNSNHGEVLGIGMIRWRGAITVGFLEFPESERRVRTWRVMQHEFTHNYGHSHSLHQCSLEQPCIMSGGFMNIPGDVADIWCRNCQNVIRPNLHLYGG